MSLPFPPTNLTLPCCSLEQPIPRIVESKLGQDKHNSHALLTVEFIRYADQTGYVVTVAYVMIAVGQGGLASIASISYQIEDTVVIVIPVVSCTGYSLYIQQTRMTNIICIQSFSTAFSLAHWSVRCPGDFDTLRWLRGSPIRIHTPSTRRCMSRCSW